jgi:hypothetical protein
VSTRDNDGVTKVELYVDGKLSGSTTDAPYKIRWNPKKVSKGDHMLECLVYDATCNVGTSPSIAVYRR